MHRLVEEARSGSIRAASRLISRLEDDPSLIPEMCADFGEWPQPWLVVGLTGAPGVGKSTLIDALISEWRRRRPNGLIGVLAVDPSSPFTGGAVLGDRIRMMRHATDSKVFIRSLANRGHMGGLTLGIRGVLQVMGLVGCDVVLIETVGVGQGEVEVASQADLTVVILAPNSGDSVQLLKAGLIEAGDLFIVNKADQPGADRLIAELTATLQMAGASRNTPVPYSENACSHPFPRSPAADHTALNRPVFRVRAQNPGDVAELVEGIERLAHNREQELRERRHELARVQVREAIVEMARTSVKQALDHEPTLRQRTCDVMHGRARVRQVAQEVLTVAARLESPVAYGEIIAMEKE